MIFFGNSLSREVREWKSGFEKTLDAVEGRAQHQEHELYARVRQGLAQLDALQVDGAQKLKAMAEALSKFPKTIDLIAQLRNVSTGRELLVQVQGGLQVARDLTRTADQVRREATDRIETDREIQKQGASIDTARQNAPSAHLDDLKNLGRTQDAYVLYNFLRDKRGVSIHLRDGLYFTNKGLRYLDPNKNKLKRLDEHVAARFLEGDVKALIAARVGNIADGRIAPHLRQI